MNCKYCKADCIFRGEKQITECKGYIPMTNADRIRAMSDEELAELIVDNYPMYAWNKEVRHIFFDGPRITHKEAWLQWLKQPADGGESG